jgi:NADPH:quinone reductase-like Zn-dependent oxidoreductase
MKAVVLNGYGGVEQLEYKDVPDPKPAGGEVLVKVTGTSLNPLDLKLRSGRMKEAMPLPLPWILGSDVSGEVVGVGSGVTRLKVGDKVLGKVDHGYAELVAVKEDSLALVPDGLAMDQAAVIPVVALTGAQIIELGVKPKAGDTILVTGALGAVGRSAIYVAGIHGALAIAGVRKSQKQEAQLLGAERVVAIDDDAEIAALGEVDAIADTVGGGTIEKLLPKLKKGGVVATVLGQPPAGAAKVGAKVELVFMKPDAKRLAELAEDVKEGDLVIPIGARFKLSEIREAHTAAEKGGGGKVLITA